MTEWMKVQNLVDNKMSSVLSDLKGEKVLPQTELHESMGMRQKISAVHDISKIESQLLSSESTHQFKSKLETTAVESNLKGNSKSK